MIGFLQGRPIISAKHCLLMVGGVGYIVHAHPQTLAALQGKEDIGLFTELVVREDSWDLYGFLTSGEKDLFQLLGSVSGVGPKTALAIMGMGTENVIHAVQEADTASFTAVPRVGRKLAEKIIIDLRSKLGELKELDLRPLLAHQSEAVEALEQLGFAHQKVTELVRKLSEETQDAGEIVKRALPKLAEKR